jgi:hypothetical protein
MKKRIALKHIPADSIIPWRIPLSVDKNLKDNVVKLKLVNEQTL